MADGQKQKLGIGIEAPTLKIGYEWETYTCRRGHTWRHPKSGGWFTFAWFVADGITQSADTGPICLQCVRDDLVAKYGSVKTEG